MLYEKLLFKLLSGNSCTYPGCKKVLVLDGNLKNQCEVCMAKHAGYIEFKNLPGSIKTGCQRTPAFKSRYCLEHMTHACTYQVEDAGEKKEGVVEGLLSKKVLRNETFYEVY